MPRQRSSIPTYRLHKQSGQAVSDFYDSAGKKRCVSLGRWQSPESKQAHARIVAEVAAGRTPGPTAGLSLNELFVAFLRHAEEHYRRPDGTQTNELTNYKHAIKVARGLYGPTPAAEFGPLALKAVRNTMVRMGWARRTINYQIRRLRKVFKYGLENELVPPAVLEGLRAVSGLQAGRTTAKESAPVLPVDPADVAATVPHLPRHVRGLVEFQRLALAVVKLAAAAVAVVPNDSTDPDAIVRQIVAAERKAKKKHDEDDDEDLDCRLYGLPTVADHIRQVRERLEQLATSDPCPPEKA